jgi:hypothetical protein
MLVVLVRDGVRCASHGLVVVDVGVSGSSHDFSVIARLITSKISTCFFLCRWTTRQVRQAKNLQWGGEYEKKGMKNYAAGNGLIAAAASFVKAKLYEPLLVARFVASSDQRPDIIFGEQIMEYSITDVKGHKVYSDYW